MRHLWYTNLHKRLLKCIKDTVEIDCIIKPIYNFKAKEQENKFKKRV